MYEYDLLVIGSGPGGQKAAIAAAKLGRRAAVVERTDMVGGVCINTGTIPSKTLREAILYLTGLSQRELYGQSYRVKQDITVQDLSTRTRHVVGREIDVILHQLSRNHVTLLTGTARFVDPHTIGIRGGPVERRVTAENIVIATGTRPARPDSVDFDDRTIVDSDAILSLERIPSSMVVVGAGVIGLEYASMFAALGTKVTVVERRAGMLEFCDGEIVESLRYHLRDLAVTFRFGETVAAVEQHVHGTITVLESGKRIPADTVLYSAGRQGLSEDQLTEASIPYEVGVSRYRELARGQILGDSYGMLKLLVSLEDRRLLGVHVFGTNATEIVHIGQAVMGNGGTVDYLVDAVFNYPTLAEAYKVAALDAVNKMRAVTRLDE